MVLQWSTDSSQEEIKIRFSNDQELNKFDMLLYLLTLNYSHFSSNSFSGYFNTEKHKWLISPFDKDQNGGGRNLDQSQIQSMQLINSTNFGQGSRVNQNDFRYNMSKLSHQEKMQTAQLMDRQSINNFSHLNNNSEINILNSNNRSGVSPNNKNTIEENMNQSMLRGSRNKRSFTPVNEYSYNPNEMNQQMQSSIKKKVEFINQNGDSISYDDMNNEAFWKSQIDQNINFQNGKSYCKNIQIKFKDPFRQQIQIVVDRQQNPRIFDHVFNKDSFKIKKSEKKERTIEFELQDDKVEFEVYEGKLDYFFRLLKFFFQQNIQKQREISKAISDLENGMIFLKYSRGSRYPHEKIFSYFQLNEKNHFLRSRLPSDISGRKQKQTNFNQINKITKNWEDGPGFKKFKNQDQRIIEELCMVIQLNNSKTIEVLAKTQQQRDLFYSYIELIWKQAVKSNK